MKKIIQQYFMAIVAVMMVVGFSAFKVVERTIKTTPEDGWYNLNLLTSNPTEYDDHDKQEIVSINEDGPIGTDCRVIFDYEPCMVNLEFDPILYNGPASIDGEKVEDVLAFDGVIINDQTSGSNDGYARKDEE